MAIELRINGQIVDPSYIGQTYLDPATQRVKQTWYDVALKSGQNTITVHHQGDLAAVASSKFYVGSKPRDGANADPLAALEGSPTTQKIRIISPKAAAVVDHPATAVTVQSPIGEAVELRVNDRLVDADLIGRTETNPEVQLMRQTWYGVTLSSGTNRITVHREGEADPVSEIEVQVRGEPTQLRLQTLETRVPADGQSTATIQGQLLDQQKNRSNWDAVITLDTTAGKFVGIDANPNAPGFQVKAVKGEFSATLQSDLQAGIVRLRAKSNDLEGFHQFQFTTPLRPSPLLTGVLDFRLGRRGTDFFDSFRDFLPPDQNNGLKADLDLTAFGIASIGDWSISGAVNSERALNTDCNGETSLFKAVGDCDHSLFSIYGDDSTTEVTAPSIDNFFLRLERTSPVTGAGVDYFTWGDYHTQELNRPSQLFSGISRDLHGFKGNYNLGNLQITGFYGNNVEGFQRDTIAPDGTSGFYFLSRQVLVSGSEDVYLELEELNRPGTVIRRDRLQRGVDYDIDYDRGTLLFRRPVLRTDVSETGEVLLRRIVATYQFESSAGETDIFGGRLQYNLLRGVDHESWLGATYFREQRGGQSFQLIGADALVAFGKDGLFIAEYAHSDSSLESTERISGDAYRLELSGTLFERLYGKAYFRSTDAGFSNNATTSFVPGQTRFGAELDAKLTATTSLQFSYDQEENFGVAPRPLDTLEELIRPGLTPTPGSPVDNSLITIRAGIQQEIGKADLGVDWVHRDRRDDLTGDRIVSDQLSTSLVLPVAKNLSLHAYNDLTLSSESDPLFPSRTTVGLDWAVHPSVTLSLNNSYFSGGEFKGEFITGLGVKGQHTFSTDTTLRGEVTMLGDRGLGGRVGIDQGLTLAPGLKMDFSYEYVFSNLFQTAASQQFIQPFAVGSGASALGLTGGHSFSAGITYDYNPDLQAGARVEHRTNEQGSNTVIVANVLGQINRDLTGLFYFQQASVANQALSGLGTSRDLKLGLAYRNPTDDTFNGLLRYEFRQNPSTIPETLLLGRGTGSEEHLISLEGIYTPDWRWEFYGKFGLRHSRTNLAKDLVGTSTVSLAQLRATYRFDYRWDVSAEARWIAQPSVGFSEVGFNAEIGYYLNPNLRLSAGYAFGDVADRDLGNSRSASGPYVGVTLKLDNNLFKDFGFSKPKVPQPRPSQSPTASRDTSTEATPSESSPTAPAESRPAPPEAQPPSAAPSPTDTAVQTIEPEDQL
jgi:hypothetical protein